MTPLYEMEQTEEWGDLKGYDIDITKTKAGDKTSYTVQGVPPKELSEEIKKAFADTKVDLRKLFEGEYPIETNDETVYDNPSDVPF